MLCSYLSIVNICKYRSAHIKAYWTIRDIISFSLFFPCSNLRSLFLALTTRDTEKQLPSTLLQLLIYFWSYIPFQLSPLWSLLKGCFPIHPSTWLIVFFDISGGLHSLDIISYTHLISLKMEYTHELKIFLLFYTMYLKWFVKKQELVHPEILYCL